MLVHMRTVLDWAEDRGCAATAFDTPTFELLLAAIRAAEARSEPVIIQHAQMHEPATSLEIIGPVMVMFAQKASVPICVMLDHGEDIDYVKRAIALGFSAVMVDGSKLPYDENVALVRQAVALCHPKGIDVEAEIGVPAGRRGKGDDDSQVLYADPAEAKRFVADTGIDALAADVGTGHGLDCAKPQLDLRLIDDLRRTCGVPLVLHGGSSLSRQDARRAIDAGVRKINYFGPMSNAGIKEAERVMAEDNPRFFYELANAATAAMQEDAEAAMEAFSQRS